MNPRVLRNQIIINELNGAGLDLDGDYGVKSAKFFKFFQNLQLPEICKHQLKTLNITIPESGRVSSFGGISDDGDNLNGLAYIPASFSGLYQHDEVCRLFDQDAIKNALYGDYLFRADGKQCGLSGYLGENCAFYCALPIKYPKSFFPFFLTVKITNPKTGETANQVPVIDYGPANWTGRICDISPALSEFLDIYTDSKVEIEFDF